MVKANNIQTAPTTPTLKQVNVNNSATNSTVAVPESGQPDLANFMTQGPLQRRGPEEVVVAENSDSATHLLAEIREIH